MILTLDEMKAELARIEQDCRDYPTIDEDEAEEFPDTMKKFGGYAAYDQHCRERAVRRKVLVRAIQTGHGLLR